MFGFGADDEVLVDDIDVVEDAPVETLRKEPEQTPEVQQVEAPRIDPAMKAKIFEGVVAVFNEALPNFLKNSVDPKVQQQRLMDSLDESCNRYLDSLIKEAEAYAEARLKGAADEARRESLRLKEEMENVNRARNAMQEQQLSADRRSRALSDRVRDLEMQLEKLEAEREQFELENKSLLNKLKVADVQPGIVDDLTREVEELRARVQADSSEPMVLPNHSEELNELKAQVSGLMEVNSSLKAENNTLQKENDRISDSNDNLNKEVEELKENFENAEQRFKMQEAMYSDLQTTLASTRTELEEAQKQASDAEEKANAKVEEANEMVRNISILEKQFDTVADVIQKRDEIIANLRKERKTLREELRRAKEKIAGYMAGTNSEGLFDLAQEEVAPERNSAPESANSLPADDFEVPDWFVSEPAPIPKESDPEFGYQEPPRKHRHTDNDAQMTLF